MSDDQPYTGPERRQDDLSARAEELSQAVGTLTVSVNELAEYGQRNRSLIRRMTAGLVGLLVLLVAVAGVAWIAIDASEEAKNATGVAAQNKQNAKVGCLVGNESRAGQIRLWTFIIDASLASNPNPTPERQKLIADVRAYINALFAPRDCDDPSPSVTTPTPPGLPTIRPTPSGTPTR
jgi:hypothetical protein